MWSVSWSSGQEEHMEHGLAYDAVAHRNVSQICTSWAEGITVVSRPPKRYPKKRWRHPCINGEHDISNAIMQLPRRNMTLWYDFQDLAHFLHNRLLRTHVSLHRRPRSRSFLNFPTFLFLDLVVCRIILGNHFEVRPWCLEVTGVGDSNNAESWPIWKNDANGTPVMSSVNDNAPSPLPVDGVSKRKQGKQCPLSA